MIASFCANTYKEAPLRCAEISHALKKTYKSRGLETAVGDEWILAPRFEGTEDGVETPCCD